MCDVQKISSLFLLRKSNSVCICAYTCNHISPAVFTYFKIATGMAMTFLTVTVQNNYRQVISQRVSNISE